MRNEALCTVCSRKKKKLSKDSLSGKQARVQRREELQSLKKISVGSGNGGRGVSESNVTRQLGQVWVQEQGKSLGLVHGEATTGQLRENIPQLPGNYWLADAL